MDWDTNGVGWLAAIVIGALAGWLAEQVMKSNMGVFANMLLGVVGAVVLNVILAALNVGFEGWLAYLVIGFVGACVLIALSRLVTGRRASV